MLTKGWVKTTFDKEYIEGDIDLFEVISKPNHGVEIHHTFHRNWNFVVYGDRDAYENRNMAKVNPDDRYKRQTA